MNNLEDILYDCRSGAITIEQTAERIENEILIREEEAHEEGYNHGYDKGYADGYNDGQYDAEILI